MQWPTHFPPHCPPLDAQPVTVVVYMLVSSPINPMDFLPLYDRDPAQSFPSSELLCQAHGLSVFEDVQDVDRVRRRVKRLRDQVIAQGDLTPDVGVLKPTNSRFGNSHRTWWVSAGVKPWLYFHMLTREE